MTRLIVGTFYTLGAIVCFVLWVASLFYPDMEQPTFNWITLGWIAANTGVALGNDR